MTEELEQILKNSGLVKEENFQEALRIYKQEGGHLQEILIQQGFVREQDLLACLSRHYGLPFVEFSDVEIDPTVLQLIPIEMAERCHVFPVDRKGSWLRVAMADPRDVCVVDDIRFMTGYHVAPMLASSSAIREATNQYYHASNSGQDFLKSLERGDDLELAISEEEENEKLDLGELKVAVQEAPVVKMANLILLEAINKGASDIHIEAYEKKFRVRYRLDGVMHEFMSPPLKFRAALTSRIKIMADLDIADRRLPQDGRIKLKLRDRSVDVRVSCLPCLFGEKIAMRILDKGSLSFELARLGFDSFDLNEVKRAISSPYGMVLVTGPTGSGKTTTLYSALNHINHEDINITTAEDPVEYNLEGVNQVQIRDNIGLNFATALRSFLRQDPDVILVGEIRDFETAEIAVKAALTGHLVLSTLHTNDAPSSINRLLNMGIEPYLVASSSILIVAQRLVRKICSHCTIEEEMSEESLSNLGLTQEVQDMTFRRGKGCASCNQTGYKGRIALYEVMPVAEEIRRLILQRVPEDEIKKTAVRLGMKTLRQSGLQKVREGLTSLQEVLNSTFRYA